MRPMLLKMLSKIFNFKQGEARLTLYSFTVTMVLLCSYYVVRPIRDAMTSNWSDTELSEVFTYTFIVSIISVFLYGVACSKIKLKSLVPSVYFFFSISFFASYLLLKSIGQIPAIEKFLYVWISIFSLFNVSVFWSLMAQLYSKAQAKRLFGFINSGASIGALIGPLIAINLVSSMGVQALLLVVAGLLLSVTICIPFLEKLGKQLNHEYCDSEAIGGHPFAGFNLLFKNKILAVVSIFVIFYTTINTFAYFELKNMMEGLELAERVRIWSTIDFVVSCSTVIVGMLITGRLVAKFGLTFTLTLLPLMMTLAFFALGGFPTLVVMAIVQVIRRTGEYGITKPSKEIIFTVVDQEARFKAKGVIDVVVYRGGDAISAWLFTAFSEGLGLTLSQLAYVGGIISAVWVFCAFYLGKLFTEEKVV